MAARNDTLTYKQDMSSSEALNVLKAIGKPLLLFAVALITISRWGNLGLILICPLSGITWVLGVAVAFMMPSMRKETLNQTMTVLYIYFLALLGLNWLVPRVSGVSGEMFAAAFDTVIPTSTGNAISGYIQSITWFYTVFLPIGQIGYTVKQFFQFKRTSDLNKTFNQKRGLRQNGRANTVSH